MRYRYTMTGCPKRNPGVFLPRPVGGGHTTPASTTGGSREIFAGMTMRVPAPAPQAMLIDGKTTGSTVNSNAGPQYIVPNRYVTTLRGMLPTVKWSPLQPVAMPMPAAQEVSLQKLATLRAKMGGSKERTRWPKAWQNYTRGS